MPPCVSALLVVLVAWVHKPQASAKKGIDSIAGAALATILKASGVRMPCRMCAGLSLAGFADNLASCTYARNSVGDPVAAFRRRTASAKSSTSIPQRIE